MTGNPRGCMENPRGLLFNWVNDNVIFV